MTSAPCTVHQPILVHTITEALLAPFTELSPNTTPHWILDCTFGGGGHTAALLEALNSTSGLRHHKILSTDQDLDAVMRGRKRFTKEITEGRLEIVQSRFSDLFELLEGRPLLALLADLGFSSDQLENAGRGLSFLREGPLDMRMDPRRPETCRELLARIPEHELADLLFKLGEERFSRRIASTVIRSRQENRLPTTTTELADLISYCIPPKFRHGRLHPATRTFQALRIYVNQEMEELDCLLNHVILSLKTGGRAAILSFHSLEDRKVKHAFKTVCFKPLTKKPIEADEDEVRKNPRARSAKLRIVERTSQS